MTRRRGEGLKRGESNLASNHFPICSPVWNTQRFRELGREEKREGGDRGDLVEKKESPKRERAVKPVISLRSKMGTKDWVPKGTKLITNTKKQR